MKTIDFPVRETVRVDTREALAQTLADLGRDGRKVRIAGSGSTQSRVPAPAEPDPVTLLMLDRLDAIRRLDPGDFTCSVEPGVRRDVLDAELAQHGLVLACSAEGTTIGGCFARGDDTALAPGGHSTRSLILGLEATLAEGLTFKAGAAVVKSVAGFDVQRLFVGSRGRLFVATTLHLKLRAAPKHVARFEERGLEAERAIERFGSVRRLASPPASLALIRHRDGAHTISGALAGRVKVVEEQMQRLELRRHDGPAARPVDDGTAQDDQRPEQVRGSIASSQIARLLRAVPARLAVEIRGSGQFDIWTETATQTDILLSELASIGATGEILVGSPGRRGRNTGTDPRSKILEVDLKRALDPGDILR